MRLFVVMSLIFAFGSVSHALTLKEKQQMEKWKQSLDDPSSSYKQTVKDKCGFEIPISFEEKMVTPFMAGGVSLASYCDSSRSAISGMCDDATSKTAIKSQVKKVTCKLGKEGEISLKLAGGDLQFTIGVNASNADRTVKEWLENNLK